MIAKTATSRARMEFVGRNRVNMFYTPSMRPNKRVNLADSSMYVPGPTRCITTRPRHTVVLGDVSVDMPVLQRLVGVERSSLSRFFSGARVPRPFWATKIADALGMTPKGLLNAVAARTRQLAEKRLDDGRKRRVNIQRAERWLIKHGALR